MLLPPSHSVIQKALYNVTQARVMSGKRHSKSKRQINREGEKENRAELFQEYHPAR